MNYTQSSATNTQSSNSQATTTPEYTNSNTPQREDLKFGLEELKQLLNEPEKIEELEKDIATLKRQVKKLKEEKVKFYHFIEIFICVVFILIVVLPFGLILSMIYFPEVYKTAFKGVFDNPLVQTIAIGLVGWIAKAAFDKAKSSITTKEEDFE